MTDIEILDPHEKAQQLIDEYSKLLKDPACHFARKAAAKTVREIRKAIVADVYQDYYWQHVLEIIEQPNHEPRTKNQELK